MAGRGRRAERRSRRLGQAGPRRQPCTRRTRRRTIVARLILLVLAAAAAVGAALTGWWLAGAGVIGLMVVLWITVALRLRRRVPAGPGGPAGPGPGPAPPGGAAMREPRRPLPKSPAGAAAMPIPDDEPPRRSVALA